MRHHFSFDPAFHRLAPGAIAPAALIRDPRGRRSFVAVEEGATHAGAAGCHRVSDRPRAVALREATAAWKSR
ncbi:hypothetical protein DelCs14_1640 [Delftia sp. Cs1-4]|nr:hypothetical protein DelCs14_1640 [Delftia sp. Cs1-4]